MSWSKGLHSGPPLLRNHDRVGRHSRCASVFKSSQKPPRQLPVRSAPGGKSEAKRQGAGPTRRVGDRTGWALDMDKDLLHVLELATDEELEEVYDLLHGRSLLSPVLKSVVGERAEPPSIGWRGREALMFRIEQRFRFLAADAAGVIQGRYPSYRETLLHLRERLEVPCPSNLATQDLETEIFLALLHQHADVVEGVSGETYSAAAKAQALEGDGMALPQSSSQGASLLQRLASPLKLGQREVLPALTKLAGALAVNNLRAAALRRLGLEVLRCQAQYQAAMQLLVCAGSKKAASSAAVQVAQHGLTSAAARYAAVRGALSLAGPLMWVMLGVDLARVSLGTDWARIVKAVFALAQIRLLRTYGFCNPE